MIRSGNTILTPVSDEKALTDYLWPIVSEMIKTAIENEQNLIVEGCYIPFEWSKDFGTEYLKNIKYYCLVMSNKYIMNHFGDIKKYASIVENRMDDESCTIETVLCMYKILPKLFIHSLSSRNGFVVVTIYTIS